MDVFYPLSLNEIERILSDLCLLPTAMAYEYDNYGDQGMQPLDHQRQISHSSKYVKISKRKLCGLLIVIPITALIIGILIGVATRSGQQSGKQKSSATSVDVKKILFDGMKAENIKNNLRTLSEKVHMAGTTQNENVLVDFIAERWKEHLDEVKEYPYNVLLSMPNVTDPNYIAVVRPNATIYDKSDMFEPALTPQEDFKNIPPTFNAYGAAGHVEGDMVFVNYASKEDFALLSEKFKVNVTGKICISKYGKSFRGNKAENAEKHGCSGLILYTDPHDYGDWNNPQSTFPENWWMPHKGVQRGSLYIRNGDPLTPYFPATEFAYRIPKSEAGLPNIPVQPISSDDAYKYLSKLGGEVAPPDWQGGIANLTYRVGGQMADEYKNNHFVIHVANYQPMREIKNVVGFIWGAEEPDRHVILGNHRDAWVFGAVDPSSGTAVMLEVARGLGELVKSGTWRPRRTIVFCSWSAEEYGLLGSIEWTEQFEKKLLLEAVTYLNVDIAVQGNATFRAKATPNLRKILYNVTKGVQNPNEEEIKKNRPTVYDTWKHIYYDDDDKDRPYVMPLGSGSDFLMFIQKTGVSSIDMRYTYDEKRLRLSSYPIYHSAHETIEYVEKFLDPEYKYCLAIAQIWGDIARRIADDAVIPFDPLDYAKEVRKIISGIQTKYSVELKQHGIELDHLGSAASNFTKSATTLVNDIAKVNTSSFLETRRINDKLTFLERTFLDFNGIPGRQQYRHVVFAPSTTNSYRGAGFSGFVDAIANAKINGDWENVKKQLATITHHITSAATFLVPF